MVDGVLARGLRPMVTLHHFTLPRWLADAGGWLAADAVERFGAYVAAVAPILDGVAHVCTINEPNVVAAFPALLRPGPPEPGLPQVDPCMTDALIAAHGRALGVLREVRPEVAVGWSVACQDFQAEPGAEAARDAHAHPRETVFLEAAAGDDWLGVQSYTRTTIGIEAGQPVARPVPEGAPRTLTGWEDYPLALGEAVRQAATVVPDVPLIVTEHGIATRDDARRIAFTEEALGGLAAAIADGADVRGYFHWSLLDNYEWGSYRPTFGLVAVDRTTFARHPKPSLSWLGAQAPR